MTVTKASGKKELLNTSFIYAKLQNISEKHNLDVDIEEIYQDANISFYEGMSTKDINIILARSASKYSDKLASELYLDMLESTQQELTNEEFIKHNYSEYVYENYIKNKELSEELLENSSMDITYYGIQSLHKDYMIGEEPTKLMILAICLDISGHNSRLLRNNYNQLIGFEISYPSPMMRSVRTGIYDIASCVTIKIGDNMGSIVEGDKAMVLHTASSSGIGCDVSAISSIGDKVRDGKITHGGKLPILRSHEANIGKATQNGRSGAMTSFINFFDPEIMTILEVKSPRLAPDKRINNLKHGIKFNRLIFERAEKDQDITLFSTREISKEMYNAFHSNTDLFIELYQEHELRGLGKRIKARDLLEKFVVSRVEDGIYYPLFVDNVIKGNRFTETIYNSNLCMEVYLPTKDLDPNEPNRPDIGVCVLSNANMAKVNEDNVEEITEVLVYGLNNTILKQKQPTTQAQSFVEQYRALGIGFSNLAYFIAKNGMKYGSKESMKLVDEWTERFQYNLIKASIMYAKDYPKSKVNPKLTKYSQKKLYEYFASISTLGLDWLGLYELYLKYGIANAVLSAIPPSEKSSAIGGQTNGVNRVKGTKTSKDSSSGMLTQYMPEYDTVEYDLAYESQNIHQINIISVIQKWVCQGISHDTFENPEKNVNKKVLMSSLIKVLMYAHKMGLKSIYYSNVKMPNKNANDALEGIVEEVVPEMVCDGACSL